MVVFCGVCIGLGNERMLGDEVEMCVMILFYWKSDCRIVLLNCRIDVVFYGVVIIIIMDMMMSFSLCEMLLF